MQKKCFPAFMNCQAIKHDVRSLKCANIQILLKSLRLLQKCFQLMLTEEIIAGLHHYEDYTIQQTVLCYLLLAGQHAMTTKSLINWVNHFVQVSLKHLKVKILASQQHVKDGIQNSRFQSFFQIIFSNIKDCLQPDPLSKCMSRLFMCR